MAGHSATAHFFVKRFTACGLVAAALLLTGCTKMVSFVGVSHYSYPVNFYCDEGGAGQDALLASNIAPGSLFYVRTRQHNSSADDAYRYRFSIRSPQGKVLDRIVLPSKEFNDASDKDGWQLVLKPPLAKPH